MPLNDEKRQKIYDRAVVLLKIRPHTSAEITRKLILKGFNATSVREVTDELMQQGLINDQQFAENFLENLIKFKTFGFYGLKAKLMQRGIDRETIDSLLAEKLSLEVESEIAKRLIDRNKNMERIKLMQKLSRKGFRAETIQEVLKSHLL
jgi:regulatory protein